VKRTHGRQFPHEDPEQNTGSVGTPFVGSSGQRPRKETQSAAHPPAFDPRRRGLIRIAGCVRAYWCHEGEARGPRWSPGPQPDRSHSGYQAKVQALRRGFIGVASNPLHPERESSVDECRTKAVPLPTQMFDFGEQLIRNSVSVLRATCVGVLFFSRCLGGELKESHTSVIDAYSSILERQYDSSGHHPCSRTVIVSRWFAARRYSPSLSDQRATTPFTSVWASV